FSRTLRRFRIPRKWRGESRPQERGESREFYSQLSTLSCSISLKAKWRGQDSNLRPRGYEPRELPGCSTPRQFVAGQFRSPTGLLLLAENHLPGKVRLY